MDKDKLWARFEKTGKVEDYLRYCGIDHPVGNDTAPAVSYTNSIARQEALHETDDRRTDHPGKQSYR